MSNQSYVTKCKFCGLDEGLKWVKYNKDDGTQGNRLIYTTDTKPHYQDCNKIKNGELSIEQVKQNHNIVKVQEPPKDPNQSTLTTTDNSTTMQYLIKISGKLDLYNDQIARVDARLDRIENFLHDNLKNIHLITEMATKNQFYNQENKPKMGVNEDLTEEERDILKQDL